MNHHKIYGLQSFFKDQYQAEKISYQQFISANFLLNLLTQEFSSLIPPVIKFEQGVFVFSWLRGENYLDLGIDFFGKFVWKIYFKSVLGSEGHLGFGSPHVDVKGNLFPWPCIWFDENKKKYFEYFLEKEVE